MLCIVTHNMEKDKDDGRKTPEKQGKAGDAARRAGNVTMKIVMYIPGAEEGGGGPAAGRVRGGGYFPLDGRSRGIYNASDFP